MTTQYDKLFFDWHAESEPRLLELPHWDMMYANDLELAIKSINRTIACSRMLSG